MKEWNFPAYNVFLAQLPQGDSPCATNTSRAKGQIIILMNIFICKQAISHTVKVNLNGLSL